MRILPRLICACLIIVIADMVATKRFDAAQQAVLQDTAQAAVVREPAYTLDEAGLTNAIQGAINASPGLHLSASVVDLQTGKRYHYGETASYTAASIAKLLTATLFLQEVESGRVSLSQQIGGISAQSQLEKMIVDSDNNAWHALNNVLTHQALNEYARSLGLNSYDADTNTVTSDDIATLLTNLASGKLLNNADTKLLLSYLERAGMRDYIVAGVPAGATAYHKTGYLSDRFHDAAIIKKGDRSFVLVIFSKTAGSYDFSKGAGVFKGLSATVSGSFFGRQ